jgi:hypothetical protein
MSVRTIKSVGKMTSIIEYEDGILKIYYIISMFFVILKIIGRSYDPNAVSKITQQWVDDHMKVRLVICFFF